MPAASLTAGMHKQAPAGDGREFSSAGQLVAAVMKEAAGARSLTCSVVQEKHLSMLAGPVIFRGAMSLEKPGRLRWEFTEPVPSIFIINGSKVMRCTPGSRPVKFDIDSNPVMKQAVMQMMAWINGDYKKFSAFFHMSLSSRGTGLVLVPAHKKTAGGITRITIMFYPVMLRPKKVRIQEKEGDWTEITFRGYAINRTLKSELFTECSF